MPELEGQPTEAPAQDAPAAPAFDPEAFKAELFSQWEAKTNERISGVQSTFQKLLNEREDEIRQLKTATLSEEEREQLAEREAEQYVEDMETRLWLATEAAQKYPKAAGHIQKLVESKGDVASFAEYLESVLNPPAPEQEPEAQVSDVDPNRPAPKNPGGLIQMPDGQGAMTEEMADRILASFGNRSLDSIRRG